MTANDTWRARAARRLRILADRLDDDTALVASGFRAHYTREDGFTIVDGGGTGMELWHFRHEYPKVDEPLPPRDPSINRWKMENR